MNTIIMIMYKRYSCENDFEPIIIKLGYRGKFQYQQFCWGWAAWATVFAESGLGRVEAFLAQALGHIWAEESDD
jgi:hypothetical protein